jgi:hypothetical protein
MTRTLARRFLPLLVAVLLSSACTTTTQRNAAVITLCVAGFAADVAISVASGTSGATGGLLGLFVCEVSDAVASQWVAGDAAQPQPVARDESSR